MATAQLAPNLPVELVSRKPVCQIKPESVTAVDDFVVFWSTLPKKKQLEMMEAIRLSEHGTALALLLSRIIQEWRTD